MAKKIPEDADAAATPSTPGDARTGPAAAQLLAQFVNSFRGRASDPAALHAAMLLLASARELLQLIAREGRAHVAIDTLPALTIMEMVLLEQLVEIGRA